MPIHVPGVRQRNNKIFSGKRNVVAVLSLTAMVDMFTVLVVFLLQNYVVTGEILDIDNDVTLPQASQVKDLKPANVVILSRKKLVFNKVKIYDYETLKKTQTWLIPALASQIKDVLKKSEQERLSLRQKIKNAVKGGGELNDLKEKINTFTRVTLQADAEVDFLTIKKVMYTLTLSGLQEINFAVIKKPKPSL